MPAFNVVEDDRDWLEDTVGEIVKRFKDYNGQENPELMAEIRGQVTTITTSGVDLLKLLEILLVAKKSV
jgi:hypothetical protein